MVQKILKDLLKEYKERDHFYLQNSRISDFNRYKSILSIL